MRLPTAFNESEHLNEYTTIPAGVYNATIIDSDLRPTKAAKDEQGEFLQIHEYSAYLLALTFRISGGEHANSVVMEFINLKNKNASATEIGQRQLGDLCRACGKKVINDTQELHGIPLTIQVAEEESKRGGEMRNVIKSYVAGSAALAKAPSGSAPVQRQAPTPADNAPDDIPF